MSIPQWCYIILCMQWCIFRGCKASRVNLEKKKKLNYRNLTEKLTFVNWYTLYTLFLFKSNIQPIFFNEKSRISACLIQIQREDVPWRRHFACPVKLSWQIVCCHPSVYRKENVFTLIMCAVFPKSGSCMKFLYFCSMFIIWDQY